MIEFEKELEKILGGEVARLEEKIDFVFGSREKIKELALTVSMTAKHSKKDVPSEITSLCLACTDTAHTDFCKTVEAAYSELLSARIDEYSDFLRKCYNNGLSYGRMREACLLSLARLSVLFNASSDFMTDVIEKSGADVDEVCEEFDKRMHGMYLRAAESVMEVYNGMVFAS